MKKWIWIIVLCLLLPGCAAPTFETLGDVLHEPVLAPTAKQITMALPKEAAAEALGSTETLYECENYSLWTLTLPSGDLTATVQTISGFRPEMLTVIESCKGEWKRYDWTWSAAGEDGDLVLRAAVIDDGDYHYCVCTMAQDEYMAQLQQAWNALFASFSIA